MNDGLDLLQDELENCVRLDTLKGHIALGSRFRWEGSRGIGEGRKWTYDGKGKLVADSGWTPTGIEIVGAAE